MGKRTSKSLFAFLFCATITITPTAAQTSCAANPPPGTCEGYPKIEGQRQDPNNSQDLCKFIWTADADDYVPVCALFVYSPPPNTTVDDSEFQHYWPLFLEAYRKYPFEQLLGDTNDLEYYTTRGWVLCGSAKKSTIIDMQDDTLFCQFNTMGIIDTSGLKMDTSGLAGRDARSSKLVSGVSALTAHPTSHPVNLRGRSISKGIRAPGVNLYRWRQLVLKKK